MWLLRLGELAQVTTVIAVRFIKSRFSRTAHPPLAINTSYNIGIKTIQFPIPPLSQ
jgi:hypothetical protein